ncbi:hypothetical protein SEA_WINKNICK_78 [Gordonia phage WinkNick]|nr:hypothetical protein SEA_WINKNICK_78 [Gordonia phage WinkNick]
MPNVPAEVDWETLDRALEYLGIDPRHLYQAVIRPDTIEVSWLRDIDGENVPGSATGLAMVTTNIHVRRPNIAT